MLLKERIIAFHQLGEKLNNLPEDVLLDLTTSARNENAWFTDQSVRQALQGVAKFLKQESLEEWLKAYDLEQVSYKSVGVIAAGNIPLVGFHDTLCVLLAGHRLMLKMSSDDRVLMLFVLNTLYQIEPRLKEYVEIVDRLNAADVYIATGSDNTARYFEQYFKGKPSIIRRNRSSLAVLSGDETLADIQQLGNDIFQYYGLGCRNISKVLAPEGYDFVSFLDALEGFKYVLDHHKYCNNYEYNKSIYLVNGEIHLDNGFLLVKESEALVSPISVLFYETYEDNIQLENLLVSNADKIQCVVGGTNDFIPFGGAQQHGLDDYADGVDTMQFLSGLK